MSKQANTTRTETVVVTRKAQARRIFQRRVCRRTFIARAVEVGATVGTAKQWWQQFRTAKQAAAA